MKGKVISHPRFIYQQASEVSLQNTSHLSAQKQILSREWSEAVKVKQIAIGHLCTEGYVEEHSHQDMDESFFILEGEGIIVVNGNEFLLAPGVFINVPAQHHHHLRCTSPTTLRFIYHCLEIIPL